jgi:hypothetical protein
MNSVLSGFSKCLRPVSFKSPKELKLMFVFDRSAVAVLLPLALLLAVAVFSHLGETDSPHFAQSEGTRSEGASPDPAPQDHTVAVNLPSR